MRDNYPFLYLSGVDCTAARQMVNVGLISQPGSYGPGPTSHYDRIALDNGCFTASWDETKWLRWLDRMPRERALFAVVPDVVCDPVETLRRWDKYADKVRGMGFQPAFVLQNGQEHLPMPPAPVLFIGGDTKWKLSHWPVYIAQQHPHSWLHMGRANSAKRVMRAAQMGCNSADGTFLLYGPTKNGERLQKFLEAVAGDVQLAIA